MRPDLRAIVFDLDDTLYRQRRFIVSGFAAIAQHLGLRHGVPPVETFQRLCQAYRRGPRGTEIQACLQASGLPLSLTPDLVAVLRTHRPRLRLPQSSLAVLQAMRPAWRIGVVTNGTPAIQAAKIQALGLRAFVDTVIFASEHGSGRGKPDPEPFEAALVRLGVKPSRAVFVGDSEDCDVRGAAAAGLRTIRVVHAATVAPIVTCADAVVGDLQGIPVMAAELIDRTWSRDVA